MDARDFVRMQYERRLRDGLEDTSIHSQTIGSFERFTKVSGCFLPLIRITFFITVIFCFGHIFHDFLLILSQRDLAVA